MIERDDEPPFLDPDADFTDDERIAAAVVLATVALGPRDAALEQRLRRDASAHLGARRRPRAVTTTSGAEVVIADGDDAARVGSGGRAVRVVAWLAVAACVGLGVFFGRSYVARSSASRAAACSPAEVTLSLSPAGEAAASGLAPCPEGMRYVLWLEAEGAAPARLATFRSSSVRQATAARGTGRADRLVVSLEREGTAEDPRPRPELAVARCGGMVR